MTKDMKWFRFYAEVLHDPKVQKLPPQLFKDWVNFLCLAAQNDGSVPENLEDIAFCMRTSRERAERIIRDLSSYGLVEVKLSTITPHNWEVRQFKSDSSADRMRRMRDKKKTSQPVTCDGHVTSHVTAPEQSRAEQSRAEQNSSLTALSEQHEQTLAMVAAQMRQRHRKLDGLGGFGLEDALMEICRGAANPEGVLLDIRNRHEAHCETDWKDRPVNYWPKLLNWIREGGYLDPVAEREVKEEPLTVEEQDLHWAEFQRLQKGGAKAGQAHEQATRMILERRRSAASPQTAQR